MRRTAALALLLLACPAFAAPTRLAVVAAPGPRAAGLADLLTVELTKADGVELVEREAVRAVAAELALDRTLGAAAVADRRKLGTVLKADALVCVGDAGAAAVRVVVCDTRTGARLGAVTVPANGKDKAGLAAAAAGFVLDVRGRYPNGVTSVVGVAPFACGNLTHDYDHLGRLYADALGAALAARPGVAVLELDEARAIQAEQALAGGAAAGPTPALVAGDYTVSREPGKPPTVAVRLRLTTAAGPRPGAEKVGLPLPEVVPFLQADAATAVAVASSAGEPVPTDRRFAALVAQADRFARVGAFETAARLREAALLADPTAHDQRVRVIGEYQKLGERNENWVPARTRVGPGGKPDAEAVARDVQEAAARLADWRYALGHLEVLVRAKKVTLIEGVEAYFRVNLLAWTFANAVGPAAAAELDEAQAFRREYVRHVFPLLVALPPGQGRKNEAFWPYLRWEQELFDAAATRFGRETRPVEGTFVTDTRLGRDDLDFGLELLTLLPPGPTYPDGTPVGAAVSRLVHVLAVRRGFSGPEEVRFTDADADAVLSALERSPRPGVAEYAKLGRAWRAWEAGGKSKELAAAVSKQAAAWVATRPTADHRRYAEYHVAEVHRTLKFDAPAAPPVVVAPPPPAPKGGIPVRVRDRGGKESPLAGRDWPTDRPSFVTPRLVACGDRFDVYLTAGAVLLHREPGRFDEVLVDPAAEFAQVTWDGNAAWVASKRKGLWALGPTGEVVARVEPADLPPADREILVHPLAPGRLLAVGSFGEFARGWVAVVERAGAGATVKVLHEARRVWNPQADRGAAADDPGWAFVPAGLWPQPDGTVLVWREHRIDGLVPDGATQFAERVARAPLRANPAAGAVTVARPPASLAGELARGVRPQDYLPDGTAVSDGALYAPDGKTLPNGRPTLRLFPGTGFIRTPAAWYGWGSESAAGRAVVPWFRVDPTTYRTERVGYQPAGLIGPPAVSAHYGLVILDRGGTLHRLDPTTFPKTAAAAGAPGR